MALRQHNLAGSQGLARQAAHGMLAAAWHLYTGGRPAECFRMRWDDSSVPGAEAVPPVWVLGLAGVLQSFQDMPGTGFSLDALAAAAEQDAAAAANARQRADQLLAEAEVAAAERMLEAAELEFSSAKRQQVVLQQELGQDSERVESVKAAVCAAAGGLAGSLPFFLLGSAASGLQGFLSLGASVAVCVLFGVTYRYAVRQDANNLQLRGGVVAAFALVKALGAADVLQFSAESGEALSLPVVATGALYAAQSMLVFGFAAAAVEAGFSNGVVKRMNGSAT